MPKYCKMLCNIEKHKVKSLGEFVGNLCQNLIFQHIWNLFINNEKISGNVSLDVTFPSFVFKEDDKEVEDETGNTK